MRGTPAAAAGSEPRSGRSRSADTWSGIGRSAGTKILVLPVSALLGILITRIIIEEYGQASFAQYGLLVGIAALLPFADLGISAAVMNVIGSSADPRHDDLVRRTLVTSLRVLTASAAVIVVLAGALTVLDMWPLLLGSALLPGNGPVVAFACLALIGVTLPLSVGQRVLAARNRNHVNIALSGLQSPMVLAALLLALVLGIDLSSGIAVVPYVATFVIAALALALATRSLEPALSRAVRDAPRVRTRRGAKVADVAWPMLVLMLAVPVAMQTDRLVLSHVAGSESLAQYTLAYQMWTPIWAVVSAAGFTLWPRFAADRAAGVRASPLPLCLAFGLAGLVLSLAVALVSPWLAQLASGGVIVLDGALVAAFTVLITVQAVKYPMGVFLTDARGLRYQALMVSVMAPLNLGLSVYLAGKLGAAGPVIGSVIGVLLFEVLANAIYVRRVLRRQRSADQSGRDASLVPG